LQLETVRREINGETGEIWVVAGKQWSWEPMWRRVADCSRGHHQPPEMYDRRQRKVVYVVSLAARMSTTADSDDCSWRHVEQWRPSCSHKHNQDFRCGKVYSRPTADSYLISYSETPHKLTTPRPPLFPHKKWPPALGRYILQTALDKLSRQNFRLLALDFCLPLLYPWRILCIDWTPLTFGTQIEINSHLRTVIAKMHYCKIQDVGSRQVGFEFSAIVRSPMKISVSNLVHW